ncbi:MAG TPA: TonB-dependent receptor [Woeseiaceae bacterium]|nr:TonB-dependent receptor [Woeseiaceae bacterium]
MSSRAMLPAEGVSATARLLVLCASVLLAALPVRAQEDAEPQPDDDLEEIVVTGTAAGAEILKFDASFAITTMSDEDITRYSPQSTADLLKLVPGVWSESSGGVSGANVMVRGFPGGGDAPYLSIQVNGAPLYPISTLAFLENTTMFRIDETVLRVEALRGGPAPVFSSGQPGLTTNFILREGGEETEGLVKYTTSDYELRRFDGYVSGPIADDFYYMIGGYISSSPGLRDAGYNSDEGNQFTINLTKDLDNGTINVFHRQTDDYGQWYLPVALNVPGVDASYNQLGAMNRQRRIMTDNSSAAFPNGGDSAALNPTIKTLDLAEGRGWRGGMTGGSVKLDVTDDWQLTDRFSLTKGDADTIGLVPDRGAIRVGDLLANPGLDDRIVITGPITGAVSGRPIGADEFIQGFGAWEVRKDVEAFTNDISLSRIFDRGTATFGYYSSNTSSDDLWSLGNVKFEVVQHGGEMVTGIACNDPAIDSCGNNNFDIDGSGDATSNALYGAVTYDITDELRADVGLRYENYEIDYTIDDGRDGDVDFGASTDESKVAWTAALNYRLSDSMGIFGRINQGYLMPQFDTYRDGRAALASGNDLIQDINQYELGFKWVTDYLSLYATGFATDVDPRVVTFVFGGDALLTTQESRGVELDGVWQTDTGFSVSLNATLLDSEINVVSGVDSVPGIDGKETERQPGWQVRLTPTYEFDLGNVLDYDVRGTVYGTLSAIDDRWGEAQNVNVLEGYEKVDLGVILWVNEAFTVQLAADNLTDEDALTESDPRTITAPNGRFIMPRSFELSVGYQF